MGTPEEVTQGISDLTSSIVAIDTKLDEIKAYIDNLKTIDGGGNPGGATSEQLDTILAQISAAKATAAAVLTEADSLDDPTPAPEAA